jgi:TPR repeat protein
MKGEAVELNPIEAAKYYRLAADQGESVYQWKYGDFLVEGKCFEPNPIEAARYYKMAADQGSGYAQLLYERLLPTLNTAAKSSPA